jgi:hypothetical protein
MGSENEMVAVPETAQLLGELLVWKPTYDDRVAPLLRTEARRRGADRWTGSDAENVIAFLLARLAPAQPDAQQGWIVSNGAGTKWRTWESGLSGWTEDREKATRYARREDAEAVHAEDDDAWRVEPYGAQRRQCLECEISAPGHKASCSRLEVGKLGLVAPSQPDDTRQGVDDRAAFRTASRGYGRAGTADMPDGPYMSMDDATEVYARLAAPSQREGAQEVAQAARAVLARWDGSSPEPMVALMDKLRAALTSAGENGEQGA